jgi:peptidoglycan-associated lipoprotein
MRFVFSAGLLLLPAIVINAQESNTPVAEVGVTYSFVHRDNEQTTNIYNENGGSGYFQYNVNRSIGLVADLGGYTGNKINRQTFTYLFGPRVNWRLSRLTPYAQFLFGGAYEWGIINANGLSTTQNGFATAAGLGFDINITHRVAVKPLQVEYLMTQVPGLVSNRNAVQNNLRYSGGLVFRFGEK